MARKELTTKIKELETQISGERAALEDSTRRSMDELYRQSPWPLSAYGFGFGFLLGLPQSRATLSGAISATFAALKFQPMVAKLVNRASESML